MNREAERPGDGRKTVLIVEDDPGTQRVLASGLATSLGMFDVLTANHGEEAVELIESRPVDVVVTDLAMPVMDGFALIGYLTNRGTTLPVVVLSALAPTTVAEGLDGYGGMTVLRKPAGYQEVARAVLEALERHDLGQVAGIPLASVLQLVEAERRTCSLAVTSGRKRGRLHFESGRLINAFSDDFGAEGEAAAYDILTWTRTAIEFDRLPEGVRKTIDMPTQMLLIEVARRQDAQREREAALTPPLPMPVAPRGATEPDAEPPAADAHGELDERDELPPHVAATASEPRPEPDAVDDAADAADDATETDAPDRFGAADTDAAAEAPRHGGPEAAPAPEAEPERHDAPDTAPVVEPPDDVPDLAPATATPHAAHATAPDPGVPASPGGAPHADLAAAIERLTQRVLAADAALAAVATEVDAFRGAQRRYDEAVRRQEERRRAVEAARRDVAKLARQILARMDGLFDAFGDDPLDRPSEPNGASATPPSP